MLTFYRDSARSQVAYDEKCRITEMQRQHYLQQSAVVC